MKQGAIIETVCDAQEWYPGLLTPMCDELATFGFVWGSLAGPLTDLRQSQGNNLLPRGLCPLGGQSTLRVAGLSEVELLTLATLVELEIQVGSALANGAVTTDVAA
jgi:hypothetical protein